MRAVPGEVTQFQYRAVAEPSVIESGLYKSFRTSLGHTQNSGEALKASSDKPSDCAEGGRYKRKSTLIGRKFLKIYT
jgi:hypothetical protein